jgi:hypothetical protein
METPTKEARIARVILRTAQRTPGVSRTMMSIQTRPYGANWTKVLQELIDGKWIIEEATIAARRKNRRAVISYRLGPNAEGQDFEELEAHEVQKLVFAPAA